MTKGRYKKKKEMGDIYRRESNGQESFSDFVRNYKKSKKSRIL